MHNAVDVFRTNILAANSHVPIFEYLTTNIVAPLSFDDLLRSSVVYAVSAFDKLMHDLVCAGMVESYLGVRPATASFAAEAISIKLHSSLMNATMPPAEVLFGQEIARKLRFVSYQDPDKVAEGLSLIWQEPHKWQSIASSMGMDYGVARRTLKLIAQRRNAIVHEADIDPLTGARTAISKQQVTEISSYLERCGCAIASLVALPVPAHSTAA